MAIGLGTTIVNNVEDVRQWYQRTMVGDFLLRAAAADPNAGMGAEVPLSLEHEIRGKSPASRTSIRSDSSVPTPKAVPS